MVRIVHVVECFSGGTFDFIVNLTTSLKNCEHIIVHGMREDTFKNYKDKFPRNTVFCKWKHVQRNIHFYQDFCAMISLIRILNQYKNADVIHLHSSKAGFLGRLVARLLAMQNRVVYTSHGVSFLNSNFSAKKRMLYIYLEKFANLCAGTVVACSKSEAMVFKRNGIQATYIFNGINSITSHNYENENNLIKIATIGRICQQKNPKLFNEIAEYYQANPQIKFLWIGDGDMRECMRAGNIEITGWVDKEEVIDRLLEVDIYLSTSFWEGLPLAVLQAMSLAKPLILSNCVGNTDLIIDHANGYIFNNKEKALEYINKLVNNTDLRVKMGNESKKYSDSLFSLKRMSDNYFQLYCNLNEDKDSIS